MGHGAIDAIDTPTFGLQGEIATSPLLLNKIDLIGKLIAKVEEPSRDGPSPAIPPSAECVSPLEPGLDPLVVFGASTGGPQAVLEILTGLPQTLEAAIILLQHIDEGFANGFGEWLLNKRAGSVTLIAEGHRPVAGEILLPHTYDHLVLGEDRQLHYTIEPRMNYFRPSVDVFFTSVAQNWSRPGVAVLLTGVGHDGTKGLLTLRNLGWQTVAQDESSCVVPDMPRAAVKIGAAREVLPLSQIAEAIVRLAPDQA